MRRSRTREELIKALQDLQQLYDALTISMETEHLEHHQLEESFMASEERFRVFNEKVEHLVAERTSQLEAINRNLTVHINEIEQFTSIASHDLQEPLRTLITYTSLVNEEYGGQLGEDGKKYMEFITGSAIRMKALVTALLDYSLLGKKAVLTLVDCNKIAAEVLADLTYSIEQNKAQIRFKELPVLDAYEIELRQLFQNLINNAVKFRQKDIDPEINISAKDSPDEWLFAFEDNGIGIEEKHQECIFTIFKRLHKRSDYEGTGIGLAHCKKIVKLHGGRIWVESTPGRGSTFMFTLPKQLAAAIIQSG